MSRLDLIPFFIVAACVLHNICLGINDNVEDFIEEGREPQEEVDYDNRENEEYNVGRQLADDEAKRNYLCLRIAGRQ